MFEKPLSSVLDFSEIYGTVIRVSIFQMNCSNATVLKFSDPAVVYIIKQLFCSLSSYMSDSQLGATHLVGYQLIYDSSSQNNC